MTDYQLQCFTPEWTGFAVFVIFFIVLFSIGLPVSVVAFLVYKRKCLQQRAFQNQFGIFYGMYRSDAYWFEGVSMMSKLALWMTLVIFEYGSEMQHFENIFENNLDHNTIRMMSTTVPTTRDKNLV